ncbi:hemolymph juvenile hormone binding protein (JHBP) [Popillia japonica]
MKLIVILLCITCASPVLADYTLPWYIKRCSLSDPNLNQCIATNGNLAIPEIVKGDCFFNNPISVPLFIPEINLPGDEFTVTLRSVYLRGLETFKLIEVGFNISAVDQIVILEAPFLEISSDYIIYDTSKLVRSIHGGGKLEAALSRNIATYRVMIKLQQDNEIMWMELSNHRLSLQTKKIYYDYSEHACRGAGEGVVYREYLDK